MNINFKNVLFVIGAAALATQPTPVMAQNSLEKSAIKWGSAALCCVAGYQFRNYMNTCYIKNNLFPERSLPTLSQEELNKLSPSSAAVFSTVMAKHAEHTRDMGELREGTTDNLLNFIIDIVFPAGENAKLNAFLLVNSYNFYRSAETVVTGAPQWWNTLTKPKAFMTGAYVSSALASVIIPVEFLNRPWIQATSNFLSGGYMRNLLLKHVSKEENHAFNADLAGLVELSLRAYYITK